MFIVLSQRVPWWRAFFKSNTKVWSNNRKTENYLQTLSNRWTKLIWFCNSKVQNYIEPEHSIMYHNIPKLENWVYSKKPHGKWGFSSSTRGRTRTGTALLPTDFKSVVSTNSTTQATN